MKQFSVAGMIDALHATVSKKPLLLDPKCDIVFKAMFTHGKDGKTALLGFINAVLDLPAHKKIMTIEYLDTHVQTLFRKQKKPVMDIIVRSKEGQLINIEMQVEDKDNFFYRTQHYLACMLHDQPISGEAYSRLETCIAINLLDYSLDNGLTTFHTRYRMHETTSLTAMPFALTEIHFIELPKLIEYSKGILPEHTLARWAFYFKALPGNKYPEILARILSEEKEINMAEKSRIKVSLMEKFLYSYRSYQRAKWDETSSRIYLREKALREGRAEGLAEGIAEGKAEGKVEGLAAGSRHTQIEIAIRMKAEGMDTGLICRTTGLSVDEIGNL